MSAFDVVVVGGGPAGLAAAAVAARHGARTALFDEAPAPGGRLRYTINVVTLDAVGVPGPQAARLLTEQAESAGVSIFASSIVWGAFPGFTLGVGGEEVDARRLVLATGSTERAMSFPGSDLAGVMTGRGLLRMLHIHRVWPGGRRVAVVGSDAFGDEVALAVEQAGGTVSAHVEAPDRVGGEQGVVAWIETGRERIGTDIVAICAGEQPHIGLALMLECEAGYSRSLGGFVPKRDRRLETPVAGLFVCGGAAGNGSISVHLAEGSLAGLAAAASLGLVSDNECDAAAEAFAGRFPDRVQAAGALTSEWTQHYVESVRAAGGR